MILTCDCHRLFCHSRESLLKKEINFFPVRVFFGSPEHPGHRFMSDCQTAQSAPVHSCVSSLLFFLFLFMGSREGRYFLLRPGRHFISLRHYRGKGYLTLTLVLIPFLNLTLIPILNLTLILNFIQEITTSSNCFPVYTNGNLQKHFMTLQYDFSCATKGTNNP